MKRILIDTDPGVDDSMMIQLAFKSPEVQVEAITAVFGNNGSEITARNALKNLEVAGRTDVPVARGANKPLTRPYSGRGALVHGKDGLGESNLPPPKGEPVATPAAMLIVEKVMQSPGDITLLAVGPLTNLALAVSLEPAIARMVKEVAIMGGAATVRGNASPIAEANIRNDPEAARIVFHAGWPLTMVGLDVTIKTLMTQQYLDKIRQAGTPVTDFISAITPFYLNGYRQRLGLDAMHVHDSSALAYILDPTLFNTQKVYVDVETQSERAFGQTMADFRGQWGQEPNVNVCLDVDSPRFLEMYLERITQ